jgi:hypothetical protein
MEQSLRIRLYICGTIIPVRKIKENRNEKISK